MQSMEKRRGLVERLEHEAEHAPARYRLKLGLLAVLGYAVLLGAVASTLGLLLLIVLYMLIVRPPVDPYMAIPIIVLGMAGTATARALCIRFVAPEGHHLQADEAPALVAEVERVRKAVGAAPLHGIVINGELNAAAAYVPRGFGIWGQRHYLILGLPLLQALDSREFAAVVAHEFGHFHGGHGVFAGWIYRLRASWYRLLEGMSKGGLRGGQLLWVFFRWYAPYFDAYSQVMARRQEYAADAVAAGVAGGDAAASALMRIELASDWLDGEFWPQLRRSARVQAYPPIEVHGRLAERLSLELHDRLRLPARLLARSPAPDDTHPTLEKRLAALHVDPRQSLQPSQEAAVGMLGEIAASLRQRFSLEWRAACEAEWKERHHQSQTERNRLAELQAHPAHTPAEAMELACLSEDYQPGIDALPLYRIALEKAPSSANGHFRLGALLLARGLEVEGLQHLHRAMELDPSLIEPALRSLDEYARRLPDDAAVHATLEASCARYLSRAQAAHSAEADLLPHALEAAQLRDLERSLRSYGKIRRAWVVQRRIEGTEVMQHYLVLLDWTGSVASERAALPRIAGQMPLPGSCTVLTTASDVEQARRLRSSAGEPAYQRP